MLRIIVTEGVLTRPVSAPIVRCAGPPRLSQRRCSAPPLFPGAIEAEQVAKVSPRYLVEENRRARWLRLTASSTIKHFSLTLHLVAQSEAEC